VLAEVEVGLVLAVAQPAAAVVGERLVGEQVVVDVDRLGHRSPPST
jgi:hypothetical protein